MYVITVEFIVAPEHAEAFQKRVQQQASDSLTKEPDCSVFEVCVDPKRPERIFLYEVYSDEAAFKLHLDSDHFKAFDAEVTP